MTKSCNLLKQILKIYGTRTEKSINTIKKIGSFLSVLICVNLWIILFPPGTAPPRQSHVTTEQFRNI